MLPADLSDVGVGSVTFFKRLIAFSLVVVLPVSVIGCSAASIAFVKARSDSALLAGRLEERIISLEKQVDALSQRQAMLPTPQSQSGLSEQPVTVEKPSSLLPGARSAGELSLSDIDAAGGMEGAELPGVADALVDFRPDFFREQSVVVPQEDKVAYLTFDDGPSARTVEILRVLDNYHVKATFFVVTKADAKSGQLLKKIAEAGHAVGMHSNSHAMAAIYASPQATLEDFSLNYDYILSVTGQAPSVFRFAGGSSNAKNPATGQFDSLIEMNRRGFVCFDWNASTGDAVSGQASKAKIIQNTINSTLDRQTVVLLAHDTPSKGTTVAALPEIIQFYQKAGYRFGTLGPETAPVLYASTRKAVLGLAG